MRLINNKCILLNKLAKMRYKLSLTSKRLDSGKCQIKFTIMDHEAEVMHGYVLSDAGATLKEVVSKIENGVKLSHKSDRLYHSHLYNLHNKQLPSDIIIFKN